jgi:hypothetical protein
MDHGETTLNELRDRIASGRYEIDPLATADAIVRRHSSLPTTGQAGLEAVRGAGRHGPVGRVDCPRSSRALQPLAA